MSQSKVIINLLPVSKGGGLQNALSFLRESNLRGTLVLVREVPEIIDVLRSCGADFRVVSGSRWVRPLHEWRLARTFPKGSVVFTLFGPPLLFSQGRLVNIVGCAYSNLFYPEIDFWNGESWAGRLVRGLIDRYRRYGISVADYWVFETEVLRRRAVELFSFPSHRVEVVKMAPGSWVSDMAKFAFRRVRADEEPFRVLYLSSFHLNKRIVALVPVAEHLRSRGRSDFRFVLSLDPAGSVEAELVATMETAGVREMFEFTGRVAVRDVPETIASCDAMCNLAVLESFSNNVVEAWASERPLLITDADWARDACGQGAVYVDPTSVQQVSDALVRLADDDAFYSQLVRDGKAVLAKYPSVAERVVMYWELIGRWSRKERRSNVWARQSLSAGSESR